jgi:hypothetical protein
VNLHPYFLEHLSREAIRGLQVAAAEERLAGSVRSRMGGPGFRRLRRLGQRAVVATRWRRARTHDLGRPSM